MALVGIGRAYIDVYSFGEIVDSFNKTGWFFFLGKMSMPLEADIFTSRAGGRDGMISIYSANPERQQRFIAREFIDQKVDTS